MTNQEIRQTWSDYYPHWRNNRETAQICRLLCELLVQRAHHLPVAGSNESRLKTLCFEIGIAQSEFEQVRNESSQ